MTHAISISCHCGAFGARIDVDDPAGNHLVCYCSDCQAYIRHLGQEERVLDGQGGTEIFQTAPHRVHFQRGVDRLSVLRMTRKGPFRWFATCCNTPLFNTLGTPKLPFAGVIVAAMDMPDGALGPIRFRFKPDNATGPVPDAPDSIPRLVLRNIRAILRLRLNGQWRETPFFDVATGRSIAKPRTLTPEEREAAYRA